MWRKSSIAMGNLSQGNAMLILILSFLASIFQGGGPGGGVFAFDQEIDLQKNRLTIDDVDRILSSELKNEFRLTQHSPEEEELLFQEATEIEWFRAKQAEDPRPKTFNFNSTNHVYPYIACANKLNTSGRASKSYVKTILATNDLMTLYNDEDMACFMTSASASEAEAAAENLYLMIQPLLPEMKIGEDTVQYLEEQFASSQTFRFNTFLCPGYSGSLEIALDLNHTIFSSLTSREKTGNCDRNLVANTFLRHSHESSNLETNTNKPKRRLQWSFHFENGIESGHECKDILERVTSSISSKNEFITYIFDHKKEQDFLDSMLQSCIFSFLAALVIRPEICSVENVQPPKPFNSNAQWIVQSGLKEKRPFFDSGLTGKGQIIACSDTGLDTDNCYFWDKTGDIIKNGSIDYSRRKIIQYVPYADSLSEYGSHGTHIVGTLAGRHARDGITETPGIADGIAPDAKITFFDIGDDTIQDLVTPIETGDILQPGKDAGANVHSISWGSHFNGYGLQEREIDEFMYDDDEFLVVVAAGNTGSDENNFNILSSVGAPATAKNVISVGATNSEGFSMRGGSFGKEYLADFSSRGPTRDGRIKPEVLAPGNAVVSANGIPAREGECDNSNGLRYFQGTSMAAPVVAGTAALIRQYFEEGWYPLGKPTPANKMKPSAALVKAILINGGQFLLGIQNGNEIKDISPYDNNQGFGRISMINSLPLAEKNHFNMKIFDRADIRDGFIHKYTLTVDSRNGCDISELSITLVWADPPALSNCKKCLLNDLDLFAVKNGTEFSHFPNGRLNRDNTNNSERIRLSVEDGDTFFVYVHAINLETASQKYSLAMSGCLSDDLKFVSTSPILSAPDNPLIPLSTDTQRIISTPFDGKHRQSGNMFNVHAKRGIVIKALETHIFAEEEMIEIEVWTRTGSYQAQESDSFRWTRIVSTTVFSMGRGYKTLIPESAFQTSIIMKEGEVRAFYVTTKTNNCIYSIGTLDNAVLESNSDISIHEGAAKTYPFGLSYKPRRWNGSILYDLIQ